MAREFRFHNGKTGAALAVRVTPKARNNKIIGITNDGTVRVHLTSASSDANFNDNLVAFIANILGVDKSRVAVVAGEQGNDKLISILNMTKEEAHDAILRHLS